MYHIALYLFLMISILIIDRVTKLLALAYCVQSPYSLTSFLSCEVAYNRGISWGLFNQASDPTIVFIVIVQCLIMSILCWQAYQDYKRNKNIIGYICIIIGTCSNIIDRILYGEVIDFITLKYGTFCWPVFNIADAAIVCGVGFLIWQYSKNN